MTSKTNVQRWLTQAASLTVLLVMITSGAWVLTNDDTKVSSVAYDPVSALPAQVLFHIDYNGAGAAKNCSQLALSELWEDKQVQAFVAPAMTMVEQFLGSMEEEMKEETGLSLDDLRALGRSHTTLTLVDFDMEESGEPVFDVVITMDLGAGNEVLGRLQAAMEKGLKEEMHAEVKMIDLGGVAVRGCDIDGVNFMWTAIGSNLVAGTQVKTMTEVLARMKSQSTAGGLLENKSFMLARSKAAPRNQAVVLAYADVHSILDIVESVLGGDAEEFNDVVEGMGLDQISDYTYAVSFEGRAVVDRFWMHTPAGSGRGMMGIAKPSPAPLASMHMAPEESFAYSAYRIDAAQYASSLLQYFGAFDPRAEDDIEGFLKMLNEQLGFSIVDDLLPSLGDEWAMWMGKAPFGSLIPEIIFSVGVKDETRLKSCIEAASKAHQDQSLVRSFKFMDRDLYYCDTGKIFSPGRFGFGMKPCWTIDGGHLILGLAPQVLKNYLTSQQSQRRAIADNRDVREAVAHLKQTNSNVANTGIGYVDLASVVNLLFNTAAPILQSVNIPEEELMNMGIDLNLLPSGDVIRRHMFGLTTATSAEKTGLLLEMHSPFGYMGMIMGVAVPVAVGVARVESQRAAQAWDDIEPIPDEPEEVPAEKDDRKDR